MQTVLHLTSADSQFWCKHPDGWQPCDEPAPGTLWVVTDLPEESFTEIQIPRIFGRDRQGFITRQLANRFPDTPFRIALPAKSDGGFMDRIAPPHQTLLGLDAAQRINSALDKLEIPIAGVWATSMLLANIGSKKPLPPDLFVVMPGADALRIVFIKNRVPVLSRLIPGVTQAPDQAAEIIRTLRHLENTRVLERAEHHYGVLLIGDQQGMAPLLAQEHLNLLDPPLPWASLAAEDCRFELFNLALASPAGQLAPLSRRTHYVAERLRKPIYTAAAIGLGLTLWAAGDNLRDIVASYSGQTQIQDRVQKLAMRVNEIEQKTTTFGVSAEQVRLAVKLDQEEVSSAPSLAEHMHLLANIIAQHDLVRLGQFEWRIVPQGQAVCARGTLAPVGTPPPPLASETAGTNRTVEINFEMKLPDNLRENARAQTIKSLSTMLAKLDGATLMVDPAKGLAQATLRGGGTQVQAEKALTWCLTLPGVSTTPPAIKP